MHSREAPRGSAIGRMPAAVLCCLHAQRMVAAPAITLTQWAAAVHCGFCCMTRCVVSPLCVVLCTPLTFQLCCHSTPLSFVCRAVAAGRDSSTGVHSAFFSAAVTPCAAVLVHQQQQQPQHQHVQHDRHNSGWWQEDH